MDPREPQYENRLKRNDGIGDSVAKFLRIRLRNRPQWKQMRQRGYRLYAPSKRWTREPQYENRLKRNGGIGDSAAKFSRIRLRIRPQWKPTRQF